MVECEDPFHGHTKISPPEQLLMRKTGIPVEKAFCKYSFCKKEPQPDGRRCGGMVWLRCIHSSGQPTNRIFTTAEILPKE